MNIEQFAEKYGLKTRLDEDGTTIIPGRRHRVLGKHKTVSGETAHESINHIYEYGDELLAVMIGRATAREWKFRRDTMITLGMDIVQDGDEEGSATFDPQNQTQAKYAIREAKVKPKRVMSEAQAKVLENARKRSPLVRQKPAEAQNASETARTTRKATHTTKTNDGSA